MSAPNEPSRVDELARQAAVARAYLEQDVAELAYKMSPEHLREEAIDYAEQAVDEAKAAVVHWGERCLRLARRSPMLVTSAFGFGGLLYAAIRRRDRGLALGALVCGAATVALGRREKLR